ncbi:MAG: hypothetical protein HY744_32215 [Deltaproteobacteria bacterium]|nr:hypothetical protein [Deltaproteobacteria bacterium]
MCSHRPRILRLAWLAAAAAAALLLGARPAHAGSTPAERAQAQKLGGEALDLYDAGDYQAALAKFEQADRLTPAPTLKVRMARCLDKLGRLIDAAAQYREVIDFDLGPRALPVHRQAQEQAVKDLATLLEQTPSIEIRVRGPGADRAVVRLDGRELPAAALGKRQSLDPGSHRVEAQRGPAVVAKELQIDRGAREQVVLELGPLPVPARPTEAPRPPPSSSPLPALGWAALGLGGAGLVAGTVTGALVLKKQASLEESCGGRQCLPEHHDDVDAFDRLRLSSGACFIAGGALVAAGAALLLLAPAGDEPREHGWIGPCPAAPGAALGLCGRF